MLDGLVLSASMPYFLMASATLASGSLPSSASLQRRHDDVVAVDLEGSRSLLRKSERP